MRKSIRCGENTTPWDVENTDGIFEKFLYIRYYEHLMQEVEPNCMFIWLHHREVLSQFMQPYLAYDEDQLHSMVKMVVDRFNIYYQQCYREITQ